MDTAAFTEDVIQFIENTNGLAAGTITAQTPLIDRGHVDSFSVMQLLLFIEERCGVSIAIDSLSLDTISTAEIIADTYATRAEVGR